MFLPIGDSNIVKGSKPVFTYLLLVLNCLIFLFQFSLPPQGRVAFVEQYGSTPTDIMQGYQVYTIITSMFLHGGWMHLIGNMLFLWVFADNIEATIGSLRFAFFYLLGGIAATCTHIYFNAQSTIPCVGASGAIAACLGAYLVMFPGSRIRVLFIIFLTTFRVPAILFLGFWIAQQFISGIGSLGAATSDTEGVAYWAHIGGFAFGLLAGILFRSKASTMRLEEDDD